MKELDVSLKVSYVAFCIFTLLGFFFASLIVEFKGGGILPEELIWFYKGNEELMIFPRSKLELAEVSHFHAFISSVVVFMHSLLFSKLPLRSSLKVSVVVLAYAGILALTVGPWIYTFGAKELIYLKYVFSPLMIISILFMMCANCFYMFR